MRSDFPVKIEVIAGNRLPYRSEIKVTRAWDYVTSPIDKGAVTYVNLMFNTCL